MMDKEFIDQITAIPLTQRRYLQLNLDREYIQYRIASYYVLKKPTSERIETDDPLLSVVSNYYLGYVEFGFLSLNGDVTVTDDYYQVGVFDHSGLLCLSRHDGSVLICRDIYLEEDEHNTDYFCATDSTAFLKALLPASIYLEQCFADDELRLNVKMAEGMLEHCSGIAGAGSEEFFRVFLGGPDGAVWQKNG